MARRRRRSFWRSANSEIIIDAAAFGSPAALKIDGTDTDASLSLYTRDAVPTLVRIQGTLILTMARADPGPSAASSSEALEWGAGFMCTHGDPGANVPSPIQDLEDEFWMQTFAGRMEANDNAIPFWNSQSNSLDYRYSLVFTAPYPQIREVSSRAKRKFEDPCNLFLVFDVQTPEGLDEPGSAKCRFIGRTLWLAS